MIDGALLLLTMATPLALALACVLEPRMRQSFFTADRLAPWASAPALFFALLTEDAVRYAPALLLDSQLGLTPLTRVFMTFTALVWLCAMHVARAERAGDPHRARFMAFMLATLAGNLLLLVARDVATFYTGFALMTFAAFGLIVYDRSPAAQRAGAVYIAFVVIGEAALLVGLILAASAAGSLHIEALPEAIANSSRRTATIALLFVGFGAKVGVWLLHMWVPLTYRVASPAACAVLSGAMLKAGLLGWLLFLPLGEMAAPFWAQFFLVAGLIAAFYGAALGALQADARTALAYSSVSQMGYMTAALGVAFAAPQAAPLAVLAATAFAIHHGLAKAAMFLGLSVRLRRRWLQTALLAAPALAIAGAPFTSGAIAKAHLKHALSEAHWNAPVELWFSFAAVGTTLLMARVLWLARAEDAAPRATSNAGRVAWGALLIASLALLWLTPWWAPPLALIIPKAAPALWPVVLGAALCWLALRLPAVRRLRAPPGDLMAFAGPLFATTQRRLAAAAQWFESLISAAFGVLVRRRERLQAYSAQISATAERRLRAGSGAALLLTLAALAIAGAIAAL